MTNSPKSRLFNSVRILTVGMGFVLFAIVCFSLSQGAFAETVTVNGMNDSTNYENVDIVDTLGKAKYEHKGTITGASSLTVNAPETNSNYRQWLMGSNGSYTFTGPINVNGGQLLIGSGTLSTKTINLNGGDMYVMYEDCLPHDAVVNIGEGSMLDVEVANNAVIGATFNVSSGGTFRQAERNVNDTTDLVTLNIAGTGTSTYRGAIHVRGGTTDLQLTANINLTNNAELFLTNMNTGKQFLVRGKLTGSSTLTLASDNAERWIRLYEGTNTATSINAMDLSEFSGNFVVDKVKARFYTSSLGTGSNITVKNSGTAIFNNTTALNNYNGSFTVNNATISLEADGKLNNLSGNGSVSYGANALTLNNTEDTTFSGVISGSGAVSKTGAKTLELTAANTYTGATTVSAGTLKLSGSGKLASSTINVESGATMLYYNTVPRNTSALTININGGTLEFYNTTATSTTHSLDNSICSGVGGQDVTINGTGGTMLIDGGGAIATYAGTDKSYITFALDSNSVINVKNGCFINGGYAKQKWTNNKATLHIGATGTVNLWNGAQMKVGGLTGEAGAKIYSSRDDGNGITIGNGTTADQTFVYNGTINLINTKTLTKNGASTQILNGDITNTLIASKAGTLVLGTANNNINIGSNSIIKTDGGAVRVDGNVVVNSEYLSVSGNWTGNGNVTVNSGGMLRINGTFGFAKGITLNGGLLFNDGEHDGKTATISAPITVDANSNAQCGWSGTLTLSGGLNGSGGLTINNDSGWTIVTGKGNYSGPLTIIGNFRPGASGIGTEATPAKASDYIGSGEITFKSNSSTQGIFQNNNNHLTFSNDLNFAKNSYLKSGWSKSMTFTGNLKGSGQLEVLSDSGWVIMATKCTDDAFTGNVQLNWDKSDSMGKMRLGSDQPFGAKAGQGNIYGTLDMNGFSQRFNGLYNNGNKGPIYNNNSKQSTLTIDTTSKNLTYQSPIQGNIALEITGTGTQTFTNNGSNFTGDVTINGGTVKASASHNNSSTTALGAFSTTGGRTITVNSGAELDLGTSDVLGSCDPGKYSANSVRLIVNGGKLSGTDNNALYNATFQNGAEVYGKNNRETWQSFWLIGTNYISFAGDGESPELPVQFNGASGVVFVLHESPVLNVDDITLSDESDLVVNVIFGNKSSSPVANNSLTKTGAGTIEFTKANTYTGGTTISKGALKFTDAAVVANGPITVGADGTLEYNLSSGQTKKLTITNASKIFGTGKIVKTGDGALQICTESAGLVDASSFIVSSGRLDMKEFFKGSLEVEAGAKMSPGNSVGTLTVDGDVNLNGGTLLMEVAGPTVDDSDQLIVTNGSLIFGEGATILLDFVNGMSPNAEFAVIIDAPNSNDDWVKYVDASYFTDLSYAQTGGRWVLSGRVDPNAVPEPSTWALLVLGVVALLLRKRVRS